MRANTNISLKDRQQLKLEDFKGVDFSASPLRVQSNRASNMSNFINEYGVNKKRNGWNELFKIEETVGGVKTPQKINGIFYYVNGSHKEMIVHAGTKFFRISYNATTKLYSYTDITLSGTYTPSKVQANLLKDQRSQSFFNKGRCYIIGCGDFLVYGTWDNGTTYELRRVANDEDTFVPTTTISIDDDAIKDDIRASLDDINTLTNKRINQLLGIAEYFLTRDKSYVQGKTYYTNQGNSFTSFNATIGTEIKGNIYERRLDTGSGTWTLDSGKIDSDTEVEITLETIEDNVAVVYTIKNNGADNDDLYKVKKDGVAITPVLCGSLNYSNGKITLSCVTTPQIENRDNIFVTFEHSVSGYLERITNCNFGILFGVSGNTDRLFLSGNKDYPNIDFHSEMDDYTYFGDLNTSSMGSDAVAINGYARLSDSTLVIYKEENGQEASIFYRQGQYKEYYDSEGNLDSVRGVFPHSAGNIGEGVVSRYACANFGGDNIILSRNGVFGIVLANNAATTERYTRERSRSINEKLKMHKDLSEAVGIVYKNRYYLAIDNVCYIADGRFKYTSETSIDDSYNYEWWYWDNIPARVWANIDNTLYFGTKDGQVCVFDDKYVDRTYQTSEQGDLSIDVVNNNISYNENISIALAENDIIHISTAGLYSLVFDEFTVDDNKVFVSTDEILNVFEGTEIYVDEVGDSGLSVSTKYYISEVDRGACCFKLIDGNGDDVSISSGGFRICKSLSQKTLYLSNIGESAFQLKEYKNGSIITLTRYNDSIPSGIIATVTHNENVVAKWYTPIFDLGTNESSKTLLKLTISTESTINGKMSFGYETRSVNKIMNAKGINVFSFDNFSFENFSFETGFANSYSVKCKERNFNFIIFRFISDNDSDCAINNFTVVYKINKNNKGVV